MELLDWLKKLFNPKALGKEGSSGSTYPSDHEHDRDVFDDTYFANSSSANCSVNDTGGSDDSCSSDSGSSDGGSSGGDGD